MPSSVSDPRSSPNAVQLYEDGDEDGFGAGEPQWRCDEVLPGWVQAGGDCDDFDDDIYPGAREVCGDAED